MPPQHLRIDNMSDSGIASHANPGNFSAPTKFPATTPQPSSGTKLNIDSAGFNFRGEPGNPNVRSQHQKYQ